MNIRAFLLECLTCRKRIRSLEASLRDEQEHGSRQAKRIVELSAKLRAVREAAKE